MPTLAKCVTQHSALCSNLLVAPNWAQVLGWGGNHHGLGGVFPICQTFTKLCLQGEVTEAETGKSTAPVSPNSDVTDSRGWLACSLCFFTCGVKG